MKRVAILLAVWLVFGFESAVADIIHVPGDYPTIQEGIDAAYEHDTVLVKPGEYVENIDFIGKNIIVASLFLTSGNPAYIDSTIIDGGQSGSVVRFENGEDSTAVIMGFTIQNGYEINGGGIYCWYSNPTISNNFIRSNRTYGIGGYDGCGGGIYCRNSSPPIINNIIRENSACWGGGVGCDDSSPAIRNNTIVNNTADP